MALISQLAKTYILESGWITWSMAGVSINGKMVIFTQDSFLTIRGMDKAYWFVKMGQGMKEAGETMKKMDKVGL
jgi:hypothetical protein